MLDTAPTAETVPEPSARSAMEQRHGRVLERLAEVNLDIVECLARVAQVQAERAEAGEAVDVGATAMAVARVSRSVRQCVALEAKLAEPAQALCRARAEAAEADAAARAKQEADDYAFESTRAMINKVTVEAVVMGTIRYQEPDADLERLERLVGYLDERLADPEEHLDYTWTPISQLVMRICKTLGLEPDWSRWRGEDWAIEEADASTPGSPYSERWWQKPEGDQDEEEAEPPGTDPPR